MADGCLVAAGIAFPAGPACGWFGMLLVDPAHRGRGFGSAVTEAAAADLERLGLPVLALFAVPKAVPLYERLGFRRIGTLASLQRDDGPAVGSPMSRNRVSGPGSLRVRAIEPADTARIFALDRGAYGADRAAMLDDQIARFPALSLLAEDAAGLAGFGLAAIRGAQAVVGPVVARDAAAALALVDALLDRVSGPVRLDSLVLDDADRTRFLDALKARGLRPRSEVPLMVRGPWSGDLPFGDPAALYVAQSAAAG
jgi:hypothetical protein